MPDKKKKDEEEKKPVLNPRPKEGPLAKAIKRMTGADKVVEGFKDSPPNAPGKDPQGAKKEDDEKKKKKY